MATKGTILTLQQGVQPDPSSSSTAGTLTRATQKGSARSPGTEDNAKTKARAPTTVAIADDEDEILALIEMMVKNWKHAVAMTATGAEPLVEAIRDRRISPEVVLMDYRMKGMNGLEAAKMIKEMDPAIKVIMVSADDSIEREARDAGLGFLQKPFRSLQLQKAISDR